VWAGRTPADRTTLRPRGRLRAPAARRPPGSAKRTSSQRPPQGHV